MSFDFPAIGLYLSFMQTQKARELFGRIARSVRLFVIPLEQKIREKRMNRFQTLVALVLSARTRDETTAAVMDDLLRAGIRKPADMARMPPARLEGLIRRCGFHHTKARHLHQLAKILVARPLPKDPEKLLELPGVGRKVANLYLSHSLGADTIAVDIHVFRISNRLFLHDRPSRNPEETEKRLTELFPPGERSAINAVLVKFGQNICLPRNPRCDSCSVAHFCPSNRIASEKKDVQAEKRPPGRT